jgi:hypothetical protein
MNQFNVSAEEARRIINVLGAGSKVGAGDIPYLNAVIEKSGTTAFNAKLSIEELVGVIEGIAPKFSQPEIAGTQLRTMFIRLQSGADELNPAIVGMETALENLANKNYSVSELTKLFGMESVNMAMALIDTRKEITQYTNAVTGSNIAVEQAIINSDNNKTRLEQARNSAAILRMELGEKLAPALTFSTNAFSYLIKAIMSGIKFWQENRSIIIATLSALAAYTIATNAAIIAKKTYSTVVWLAAKAQQAFNLAVKVNPWALAASAIIGLLVYIRQLGRETDSLTLKQKVHNEIRQESIENSAKEVAQLEKVFAALRNTNTPAETRNRLIKQINDQYKDYLPNLLSEKSSLEEIKTAYDNIAVALRNKIEMQARQNRATRLFEDIEVLEAEFKQIQQMTAAEYNKQNKIIEGVRGAAREAAMNKLNGEINEMRMVYEELLKVINTPPDKPAPPPGSGGEDFSGAEGVDEATNAYDELNKKISEAQKHIANYVTLGDLTSAQAWHKILQGLLAQKYVLDQLIAAGGDMTKMLEDFREEQYKAGESIIDSIDAEADKLIADEIKALGDEAVDATNKTAQAKLDEYNQDADNFNKRQEMTKQWKDASLDAAYTIANATADIYKGQLQAQTEAQITALNRRRDAELSNENLTAEQREKIEEKYRKQEAKLKAEAFRKQKAADVILSIINTGLAVTRAMATPPGWPLNLPQVIAAGLAGAAQTAVIASQKVPQFSKGRYNVIGQDDGRTYNVPFMGPARTGIYERPALISEQGPELIVDAPTTKNLRLNYPEIIQAIHQARVPQYAEGRMPNVTPDTIRRVENTSTANIMDLKEIVKEFREAVSEFKEVKLEAHLVYQQFRDFTDKVTKTESSHEL